MIVDNKYPLFEQLINPYYQTDYVPQSCFPYPEETQTDKDNKEKNENNQVQITNEDNEYEDYKFDEDQPKITDEKKEHDYPILEPRGFELQDGCLSGAVGEHKA